MKISILTCLNVAFGQIILHIFSIFVFTECIIHSRYISVLPTIHLSSIIPPEEAIKFRKPYWKPRWPPDTTPVQFPQEPEAKVKVHETKQEEKVKKDISEEQDDHRNNKAEFDAFSEEYLRKYYPFIDAEQIQHILKYYPRSRQEFVITVCLGVLSVICISYFLMALYRCMCSKKYSKWRASWSKSARKGKMNTYIKQIKDALPIVLKGHLQVCIHLSRAASKPFSGGSYQVIQIGLCSYRRWLEPCNFRYRKKKNCSIC